jgi:DNA-binding transcriptional ArsR family regulator
MRPIAHPALDEVTLPSVLYALSDPVRLQIVQRLRLAQAELSCQEAVGIELPKSTMSFHFKALREAGLIRSRQAGRSYFSVINPAFDARFPGLLDAVLAHAVDPAGED